MKILLGLLLTFISQALIAGCPSDDLTTYNYMTRKELISAYCSNYTKAEYYEKKIQSEKEKVSEYLNLGKFGLSIKSQSQVDKYTKERACVIENYKNASRTLQKDYERNMEKQEEINCE